MPYKGCMPTPGVYVCGPNATQNLYHDFEETSVGGGMGEDEFKLETFRRRHIASRPPPSFTGPAAVTVAQASNAVNT